MSAVDFGEDQSANMISSPACRDTGPPLLAGFVFLGFDLHANHNPNVGLFAIRVNAWTSHPPEATGRAHLRIHVGLMSYQQYSYQSRTKGALVRMLSFLLASRPGCVSTLSRGCPAPSRFPSVGGSRRPRDAERLRYGSVTTVSEAPRKRVRSVSGKSGKNRPYGPMHPWCRKGGKHC